MAHEIDALFMFGDDLEAILDFTNYGSGQSFFVAVFISTERYFHFYSFFFYFFFYIFFFLHSRQSLFNLFSVMLEVCFRKVLALGVDYMWSNNVC